MNRDLTISVIVPAFNAAWCLSRALDSVFEQSRSPDEVIVVNDGSLDETANIAQSYRVQLINQENRGLSAARNTGVAAANSDLVAFLDADDWWHPEKLAIQRGCFLDMPELGFCSTRTEAVDENQAIVGLWECPIRRESWLHTIFRRNAAVAGSGSSVMVRRSLLERAGKFDVNLKSLEDVDLWMRLAALGDYRCIPSTLTYISKRSTSMSGNLAVMRQSALAVMKKNRHLLVPRDRRAFWRHCYAGVLLDYAAWQARERRTWGALKDIFSALAYAPLSRSRMALGLLLGLMTGAARSSRTGPSGT